MSTIQSPSSLPSSSPASTVPRNPVAHGEVLAALGRLATTSLAQQARDTRLEISLDGVPTYWRRPVSAVVPAFQVFSRGDKAHLQIWHRKDQALLQFLRGPDSRWALDRRITAAADMIPMMPVSAFVLPEGEAEATPAQLEALRRMLQLSSEQKLPRLHRLAATRLLDRLLLEPALVRLRAAHLDHSPMAPRPSVCEACA